eukprot:g513.t1
MGCVQGAEVARPDPPVRGPASDPGAGSSTVVRKPPPPAVDVNRFIHPRSLARFDPFQEEQPDWRWEKDEGQWRSYPLNDSIELDRYWQVFAKAGNEGGETKAKLKLLKTDVVVDFAGMTAQADQGRPRKIERKLKTPDWLSNRYFFDAFTETLTKAGCGVEMLEQFADCMIRPPDKKVSPAFAFEAGIKRHKDFRDTKDDGRKMFRGGREYFLPVGWKRFAVQVKGVYDEGDNAWLRLGGILCTGFRVGERQKFEAAAGAGVYCTPRIDVAQHYSKPTLLRGHSVQIVLQLRVRPGAINPITDPSAHEFERKYWVINNPDDIRAYGVLIRELPLRDYILPEARIRPQY